MSDSKRRGYVVQVCLALDGASAPDVFERVKALLDAQESVLDYRVQRVAAMDKELDKHITDGSYVEGTFAEAQDSPATPAVGSDVVWNDADRGLSTGVYRVAKATGCELGEDVGILSLVNAEGGYAEALVWEVAQ